MIRHSDNIEVEGYDPGDYEELYYKYYLDSNRFRREQYDEIKDERNARRREAYRKKYPDSEKPFRTIDERKNEDKKSIIKPHNVIKNLEKTKTGREALTLIKDGKIKVDFCYGMDNLDERGKPILGYYDTLLNRIVVFADATETIEETASTVIHEAFHSVDYGLCQKSEVFCVMKEMMHKKGIEQLTRREIKSIIKSVKKSYSYLPWR